ncbi:MAG: hypothetical protein GDA43_02130 [Hormoscilla sp. SP5CHS1]|nr:hypothetical protein [Hormoscilla sp. SP12CHS1]MBC6452129.1 hypothetical protein [Hormoscilla sp. SP5CHS1]
MSTQVTVTLPEKVYSIAMRLAQQRNRDVADLLAETIERSLSQAEVIEPVESASDSEVMALTQLQMPPDQDDRLSLLLYKQQAETLGIEERSELSALMEIYKEGLLRKAQALKEAVKRGLMQPL